jgi:hypothetical protein
MVVLLGSGAVFAGAVGGGDAEALPPDKACQIARPLSGTVKTPTGGTRSVVMALPCCTEGYSVFLKGIDGASASAKRDLNDFHGKLAKMQTDGQMLEYCLMLWGLTEDAKNRLEEEMKARFHLTY